MGCCDNPTYRGDFGQTENPTTKTKENESMIQ